VQAITEQRYAPDMRLEDPVATCTNRSQYLSFIRTLRTFFDTEFQIRDVQTSPPAEIVVR